MGNFRSIRPGSLGSPEDFLSPSEPDERGSVPESKSVSEKLASENLAGAEDPRARSSPLSAADSASIASPFAVSSGHEQEITTRFIDILSSRAHAFLFSYSPKLKTLLAWSSNAQDILGVPDSAIIREGNLFLRHVHPEDRFRVLAALEEALRGETHYEITYRWIRPDKNELRWLHCRADLNRSGGATKPLVGNSFPDDVLLEGFIIDVSSGEVFRGDSPGTREFSFEALEALPQLIFLIDKDLRLLGLNRSTEQRSPGANLTQAVPASAEGHSSGSAPRVQINQFDFGDTSFSLDDFKPGRLILPAFGSEAARLQYARVFEQLLSGAVPTFHTRLTHIDPPLSLDLYPWRSRGEISGVFGVVSDLSTSALLERQLSDLRRAEGLRTLAAGVSHHVNNVLQAIIGQATVINSHADNREEVLRSSSSIMELVRRASDLTQQLFLFDDTHQGSPTPVDLNLSVMAAVSAVEEIFASPVEIQVSFGNPSPVLAKQQSLVDAIREVLRIAREHASLHGSPDSQLVIKTYQAELQAHEIPGTRPGHYAHLVVTEISKSHAPSAPPLKLMRSLHSVTSSVAFRRAQTAVERFGGTLSAQIPSSGGFSIALILPAMASPEDSLVVIDEQTQPQVLIVDDDQMVLQTVDTILKDAGYRCASAQSAARALNLARAFYSSVKVVLLDAIMPGQDEEALLHQLLEILPQAVIIGFTGASAEREEALRLAGAQQVLRKPVDPKVLRETVRGILQSPPRAANG